MRLEPLVIKCTFNVQKIATGMILFLVEIDGTVKQMLSCSVTVLFANSVCDISLLIR